MKRSIWLSFDLGIGGDFENMYAWLEDHQAKECGTGIAYVPSYEYEGELLESLNSDISEKVQLDQRSRVYVIFTDEGRAKGGYLKGKRRAPPWTGYGSSSELEYDEAR